MSDADLSRIAKMIEQGNRVMDAGFRALNENLASVAKSLEKWNETAVVSSDPNQLALEEGDLDHNGPKPPQADPFVWPDTVNKPQEGP